MCFLAYFVRFGQNMLEKVRRQNMLDKVPSSLLRKQTLHYIPCAIARGQHSLKGWRSLSFAGFKFAPPGKQIAYDVSFPSFLEGWAVRARILCVELYAAPSTLTRLRPKSENWLPRTAPVAGCSQPPSMAAAHTDIAEGPNQ